MIFDKSQRNKAINFIDKHLYNNNKIEIKAFNKTKSLSQNAYLWLIFTHVAYETGNNKNDIYFYYLNKFPVFKKIYNPSKEEDLVPISLSYFNKEQTSFFIDNVVVDARQEGFDIPDPEDIKCSQMYDYYREKGIL